MRTVTRWLLTTFLQVIILERGEEGGRENSGGGEWESEVGKEETTRGIRQKGLKSHGEYNRAVADCASFINSEASWIEERAMRKATC